MEEVEGGNFSFCLLALMLTGKLSVLLLRLLLNLTSLIYQLFIRVSTAVNTTTMATFIKENTYIRAGLQFQREVQFIIVLGRNMAACRQTWCWRRN
jgi:low affinity Fe/Cu permease